MGLLRAISLDFWGTLATFNPGYSQARTSYLADLFGVTHEAADDRYKKIKRSLDFQAENFGKAVFPLEAVRMLIDGQHLARDTNAVEVYLQLRWMQASYPPLISANMSTRLQQAALRYKLCITSNTNFVPGKNLRRRLPTCIERFNFSDETGVSKPDPDMFRITHQMLSDDGPIDMQDIVHIGDHKKCDIYGAKRAGMRAHLVVSPLDTERVLQHILDVGDLP